MEVIDFLKEGMDILLSSTYCPNCVQAVQWASWPRLTG